MSDVIQVKKSFIDMIIVLGSLLFAVLSFLFFSTPYTSMLVFTTLLLIWSAYYTYMSRAHLSEMCCMMSGMAFGMISGFFIGTIAGLATGDFLVAMIIGTIAGIAFGMPLGRLGGPLGRMEGVMAGPMGGIMGGMTGIMVRFFDVQLFMPFFILVVLFTVWEMTHVIHSNAGKIPRSFVYLGIVLSLLAFASTVANDYNIQGTGLAFAKPLSKDPQTAPVKEGVQEVTVKAEALGYNPNYIVVKKGTPVKLNLKAAPDAGCTRAIVFPDFNIRKTVPRGGEATVEFTPAKTGTFRFSCSMAMAGGTLVVQ